MNFRTKSIGRLILRLLLLFSMVFCVYIFYLNAKQQAKLYRDYRDIYSGIAELDTLNTPPTPGSLTLKVIEHDGAMNANAGTGMFIFINSIFVTVVYFLYVLISEIYLAIKNNKVRQNQNKVI